MNKLFFIARLGTVLVLLLVLSATQPALMHPALVVADLPIYADALDGDWQDWSWDTTRSFDNAQPVHSGSASVAVTFTAAWGGLLLHTDTALPASGYTAIRFWVHGGSTGGQSVNFHVTEDGVSYPFIVQANTWTQVTVPFAALGNPTTLSDLFWQDGSGDVQPTFYLDDISLIGQWNYVYLPLINNNYCSFHYFDDFSDPNSGWDVEGNDSYLIRYLGGEYQILLNYPNSWAFGLPNLDLPGNYRLEVDARQTSAYGSAYGMLFGIGWGNDTYEAYQFLVEPQTQKYLLDKRSMNGSWNALIGWTDASIINSGTGTNHLVVERIGSAIYLYINDVWVDTAYDSSFISPGRDMALYVDSYNQAPLDVRFDNFRADCLP
jgi:hypothetical protein